KSHRFIAKCARGGQSPRCERGNGMSASERIVLISTRENKSEVPMNEEGPLTLTYDSFANFWKALVSRRKAKRLSVDKDKAWTQLRADGAGAAFLRAEAARKEAKKTRRAADGGKDTDAKRPKAKASKKSARRAAKTSRSVAAKRPAA